MSKDIVVENHLPSSPDLDKPNKIMHATSRMAFIIGWLAFWPTLIVWMLGQLCILVGVNPGAGFYITFWVIFAIISGGIGYVYCGDWLEE